MTTHSDRDRSETTPEVNQFSQPQEATGATPAPLAPCPHCGAPLSDHQDWWCEIVRPDEAQATCHGVHQGVNGWSAWQNGNCPHDIRPPARTSGVPAGLPLHEPTDRDGDNVPSDEERTNDERWQKYATGVLDSYTTDQRVDVVIALADAELAGAWDEGFQAGMWAEQGYPQENPYRAEPTEERP